MNHNQRLGRFGEDLAARALRDLGLSVLDQNWRCARGEIDIVAREGDVLVFCEVKTRRSSAFGSPAAAVVGPKARRLRSLAIHWLAEHHSSWTAIRFDVIGIFVDPPAAVRVEHLRGAF